MESVEGLLQGGAWTADIHAHKAGTLVAKGRAFVQRQVGLVGEERLQLAGREVELATVEKNQERGLRTNHLQQGHLLIKKRLEVIHIRRHIVNHLAEPLCTFVAQGCRCCNRGKDVGVIQLALH